VIPSNDEWTLLRSELKEQNFALKEENTQLQKKIKEIAQSTLDDSIKNLKELRENL
jgi:hypothetical protein